MDTREINDNKIARIFSMSRDAVLGLRQETVVFANAAAANPPVKANVTAPAAEAAKTTPLSLAIP